MHRDSKHAMPIAAHATHKKMSAPATATETETWWHTFDPVGERLDQAQVRVATAEEAHGAPSVEPRHAAVREEIVLVQKNHA